MNTERPIREWYDLLPEPERTEAHAARDRAEARGGYFASYKTASSLHDALMNGFGWTLSGGKSGISWAVIHARAETGEFNGPSEVDRLRARIAELEGALKVLLDEINPINYPAKRWDDPANNILENGIGSRTIPQEEPVLFAYRTILNKK